MTITLLPFLQRSHVLNIQALNIPVQKISQRIPLSTRPYRNAHSAEQVSRSLRFSSIPSQIFPAAIRPAIHTSVPASVPAFRPAGHTFAKHNSIAHLTKSMQRMSLLSTSTRTRATQLASSDEALGSIMVLIGGVLSIFLYNDSTKRYEELIHSSYLEKEEDRLALINLLKIYASTLSPQILRDILFRLSSGLSYKGKDTQILSDCHIEIVRLIMQELLANDSKKLLQLQKDEFDQPWVDSPFCLSTTLALLTDVRCKDLYDVIKDKVFQPTIERACLDLFAWSGIESSNAFRIAYGNAQRIAYDGARFMSISSKSNPSLSSEAVNRLFPKVIDFYQRTERDFKSLRSEMVFLCEAFCNISSFEKQPSSELLQIGTTLFSLFEKKCGTDCNFSATTCTECLRIMDPALGPSEFEALVAVLEVAMHLGIAASQVQTHSEHFCKKILEYNLLTHCPSSLLDRVIYAFKRLGADPELIARLEEEHN